MGIFDNGDAMTLAGLAVLGGQDVGAAINEGLTKDAAIKQHQFALQQAKYQAQQAQNVQQNIGAANLNVNDPQGSIARLMQMGMPAEQAATLFNSVANSAKERRLEQQQGQAYGFLFGNPGEAQGGQAPAGGMGGAGTAGSLSSMSEEQLMKGMIVPSLMPIFKAELDRREREQKRTDEDTKRVVPPTTLKDIAENEGILSKITDAQKELSGNPGAFGVGGYLAQNAGFNLAADPKNVSARAVVGDLSSSVIKDRSGAAVSLAEFPRLAPFIPQIGDQPKTIKAKLQKLAQGIKEENAATLSVYKNAGYNIRDLKSPESTAKGGTVRLKFNPQTGGFD